MFLITLPPGPGLLCPNDNNFSRKKSCMDSRLPGMGRVCNMNQVKTTTQPIDLYIHSITIRFLNHYCLGSTITYYTINHTALLLKCLHNQKLQLIKGNLSLTLSKKK